MTTDDDRQTRAAEYVLGTLDLAERVAVDAQAARDPALRALLAQWQQRLAGLDTDTSAIAPPAAVWDRIESAIDDRAAATRTVKADAGQWSLIAAGVEKKVLLVDRQARMESYILRFQPGATLPAHDHTAVEECLVLEGDVSLGDLHLTAGDFHVVGAGASHPQSHSVAGALVYIRGELRTAA